MRPYRYDLHSTGEPWNVN